MRRDAKLGLALGMLVIGFGIAFCFPRQHNFVQWQQDETTVETDGLDFLPIRAYQTQSKSNEAASGLIVDGEVQPTADGIAGNHLSVENTPSSGKSPQPIQAVAETEFVVDASQSVSNIISSTVDSEQLLAETSPLERSATASEQSILNSSQTETYTVQSGDTLSGIATKILGDTKQFMSIYDANRDVLRSPDDLRVGLKLRIPKSGMARPPVQTARATLPENSAQTSSDAPAVNHYSAGESSSHELDLDHEDHEESDAASPVVPAPHVSSGNRFQRPKSTPFLSDSKSGQAGTVPSSAANNGTTGQHTVKSGDTLEGISMKYFGHPRGVRVLQQANPKVSNPKRLRLGMTIEIPKIQ